MSASPSVVGVDEQKVGRMPPSASPCHSAEPEPASSLGPDGRVSAFARRRNWRGQFVKQMRPTPPDARVWLIWSKKWGRWHRRSECGGACGYTDDLTQAGLFPFAKAREYNDGWDNTVFHVSEKEADFRREIARMERKLATFKHRAADAFGSQQ